jgi:hypothetical protein
MRRLLAAVLFVSVSATASGCLGTSYRIPKRDLQELAQLPPEVRAQRVRVIQGFANDEGPPPAPTVHNDTVVVVHGGVYVDSPGSHHGPPVHSSSTGKAKAEEGKWWFILAAIVAVSLAVTEGARYDGWVQVHPMHPVHLYGPYGEYRWVPLAQLDPQTAAWARRAYLRQTEGPWTTVGRAPLDRAGWTFGMTLGVSEFPSEDDTEKRGFMGHIQLGLFPAHEIGVLLDFGMGWAENSLDQTVADFRNSLELQFLPLDLGIIHMGGFGQIGIGARWEDGEHGATDRGILFGGGVLVQLELTTRLAITGRLGITSVHDETTSDATLGISVY